MKLHRAARLRPASRGAGHDRWLISYADFITLLFAFFTVMYAGSTVDVRRMTPAAASIQQAFALPDAERDVTGRHASPRVGLLPGASGDPLDEVRRRLAADLGDAIESGRLEMTRDARGLVLSLPVEATFAIASAEVQPDARVLLGRLAAALRPLDNAIRIEGHTDDVPISNSRYGSNWELSTARASAVVEFLIREAGYEPPRLAAAGYGEFHPRVPNDSPENRARNRRVDLVVLGRSTPISPSTGGTTP